MTGIQLIIFCPSPEVFILTILTCLIKHIRSHGVDHKEFSDTRSGAQPPTASLIMQVIRLVFSGTLQSGIIRVIHPVLNSRKRCIGDASYGTMLLERWVVGRRKELSIAGTRVQVIVEEMLALFSNMETSRYRHWSTLFEVLSAGDLT